MPPRAGCARCTPVGSSSGDDRRAEHPSVGTLQLVATPIGNLDDVTPRALRALGSADLLLAEDTRRTRVLLDRHGVKAKPVSLHAHNEAARVERAVAVLEQGGVVALVSDAGTPVISDPGERLVAAAIAGRHRVTIVPGPSAVSSALAVSGLPPIPFTFAGFLPRAAGARDALLEDLGRRRDTLVLFESPHRLVATLQRLAALLGDRRACVARELTKMHEEVVHGSLFELAEHYRDGVRGEVTLVVEGAPPAAQPASVEELDAEILAGLSAGESSRELSQRLARESGLARRVVYARILALRDRGDEGGS